MKVINWWKLSSDKSYQDMKVMKWWKLSGDGKQCWKLSWDESYLEMENSVESYLGMKVILGWKLSWDESYLVMKVICWWKLKNLKLTKKWKGVMAGDVSPVAVFSHYVFCPTGPLREHKKYDSLPLKALSYLTAWTFYMLCSNIEKSDPLWPILESNQIITWWSIIKL